MGESNKSEEDKLVIDETQNCEDLVGEKSLKKHDVKATPVRRRNVVKKTSKKKPITGGTVVNHEEKIDSESKVGTKAVSRKVQKQAVKEKESRGDKANESLGPFQCSNDKCQDSWVKMVGWERKALTHFLRDHDPMISEMKVKDKGTG